MSSDFEDRATARAEVELLLSIAARRWLETIPVTCQCEGPPCGRGPHQYSSSYNEFTGLADTIWRTIEKQVRPTTMRMVRQPPRIRPRNPISKSRRLFVLERDGFTCQRCGAMYDDLQIDHIQPWSKGGSNDPDNLQVLCRLCNIRKGDRV